MPTLRKRGFSVRGIIVHHRRHLDRRFEATDDPFVLRCTLQQLDNLLHAKRLCAQRHRTELVRAA